MHHSCSKVCHQCGGVWLLAGYERCECCVIKKRSKQSHSLLFWVQFCENISQFKLKRHRAALFWIFLCADTHSRCYLRAGAQCQWFDAAKIISHIPHVWTKWDSFFSPTAACLSGWALKGKWQTGQTCVWLKFHWAARCKLKWSCFLHRKTMAWLKWRDFVALL